MTRKTLYTEYWHLLDHLEDAVRGEFRETHSEPPSFPETERGSLQESGVPPVLPLTENTPFFLPDICRKCGISMNKKRPVPGKGSAKPRLVVVLDPPSAAAERDGIPLIAEEMEFLSRWVDAIGLDMDSDVYLTNVIKCRPPGNRPPFPDEAACCLKYLDRELDALEPLLLLAAGETAGKLLSGVDAPLSSLRKTTHTFRDRFLVVTYPPSQVLYDERLKRPVWEDLKLLKGRLDGAVL